ncbi:hypothetical protein ONZ45_g4148 [Pleurotus djamor]|nr:hypothetical protein ONZ45_g4148 [Pleurotus djamor]
MRFSLIAVLAFVTRSVTASPLHQSSDASALQDDASFVHTSDGIDGEFLAETIHSEVEKAWQDEMNTQDLIFLRRPRYRFALRRHIRKVVRVAVGRAVRKAFRRLKKQLGQADGGGTVAPPPSPPPPTPPTEPATPDAGAGGDPPASADGATPSPDAASDSDAATVPDAPAADSSTPSDAGAPPDNSTDAVASSDAAPDVSR